jgi:hypothetical protein
MAFFIEHYWYLKCLAIPKKLTIKSEKSRQHIITTTRNFLSTSYLNTLKFDIISRKSGIAKVVSYGI